jgi:hypothetical protein
MCILQFVVRKECSVLRFFLATGRRDFFDGEWGGGTPGSVYWEGRNADAIGVGPVHQECTVVDWSTPVGPPLTRIQSDKAFAGPPVVLFGGAHRIGHGHELTHTNSRGLRRAPMIFSLF